jgi:hypothetical protein
MMRWLLNIKSLGMCKYPLDATLISLDTIHDPKANKRPHNTKTNFGRPLFQRFVLILDEFEHVTSSIGKDISLPFQRVQELHN